MGLLERILGRKADLIPQPEATGVLREDAEAVEKYERMLRTAPPDVIERAHLEAFEKLTPAQLGLVFERFTSTAPTEDDKPADARPATLARSAANAESRQPGAVSRALASDSANASVWAGSAVLDTVIWYAIASTALTTWTSHDDAGSATGPDAAVDAFGFEDLGF